MARTRVSGHDPFGRRPEAPLGPVALNRAADLAADGISDTKPAANGAGFMAARIAAGAAPRFAPFFAPFFTGGVGPDLQYQTRRHPFVPGAGHAQEFAALLQPQHVGGLDGDGHGQAGLPRSATPSRRKTLPPLGPAGGKNPAAANGRHAAAESMPAFTDNFAWLKGALHGSSPTNKSPLYTVLLR